MTAVLIAGFHRSGTSMVARMFHEGGLHLGDMLLAPHSSNPYGHFEDSEVIAFHDRLLRENATTWQFDGNHAELVVSRANRERLSSLVRHRNIRRHWGVKDPRICLFLKDWVDECRGYFIVAIFRDFLSTTQSLLKRHSSDLLLARGPAPVHLRFWQDHELPYRMWLAHNRSLLEAVKAFPERSLVVYHSQVLAGMDVPAAVNAKIQIGMKPIDPKRLVDPEATETAARNLPPIRADLREVLIQTWREIESAWGPSGVLIEEKVEEAFEAGKSSEVRSVRQSIVELDRASAEYAVAMAHFRTASAPVKKAAAKPAPSPAPNLGAKGTNGPVQTGRE